MLLLKERGEEGGKRVEKSDREGQLGLKDENPMAGVSIQLT